MFSLLMRRKRMECCLLMRYRGGAREKMGNTRIKDLNNRRRVTSALLGKKTQRHSAYLSDDLDGLSSSWSSTTFFDRTSADFLSGISMASTNDTALESNHLEDQDKNTTVEPSDDLQQVTSDASDQSILICESDGTDRTVPGTTDESMAPIDDVPEVSSTMTHSANMVTAEASFTEATSVDLQPGATRSSVARILVKPGQVFRVQVDNEVKEVHGKSSAFFTRKSQICNVMFLPRGSRCFPLIRGKRTDKSTRLFLWLITHSSHLIRKSNSMIK